MVEIVIKTKGMHCVSCERIIKDAILSVNGVKDVKVDYTTEKTIVDYDPAKTNVKNIMETIKNVGYEPEEMNKKSNGFFKKLFK